MLKYRKANLEDINKLIDLRKKQLVDEGIEPDIDIDTELNEFFINKLSDGSLIQWLVDDSEEIIACAAVIFNEFPPTYTNKSGRKAYITNMYTMKITVDRESQLIC